MTNINVETNQDININITNKKPKSLRYRFSVPKKDESVNQWMNLQSNPSQSIRQLIRESIRQEGFIDVTCRPEQYMPETKPEDKKKKWKGRK